MQYHDYVKYICIYGNIVKIIYRDNGERQSNCLPKIETPCQYVWQETVQTHSV